MSFQSEPCDGNKCSYSKIEFEGFSVFLMSSPYKFLEQVGKIES